MKGIMLVLAVFPIFYSAVSAQNVVDTAMKPVTTGLPVAVSADSTVGAPVTADLVPPVSKKFDTSNFTVYSYDTSRNSYTITSRPKESEPVSVLPPSSDEATQAAYVVKRPALYEPRISDYARENIQSQIKSAKQLASAGAAFYGIGLAVEVIGLMVFISEISNVESSYDPYYGYSYEEPSMGGLYAAIVGGLVSFGGTIASNAGGSRARLYYSTANYNAPPFKGWGYFGASIGCSVFGSVLSMADVPVAPGVLSLTSFIFGLSSVVHSCNYANRIYASSLLVTDLKCLPMVDLSGSKSIGLSLTGGFGFAE